ncbi:unnamed protein product [Sphagnum troendelagicum]|uniref:Protein kinase domain-containing protein n=1 Tax=Sphagnum troendelagicum TaxID=128251 RepID=A0ABP0U8H0_9BRYO
MGHLVIDGIDTVLHQTNYFEKEGGDVKNFVVLNRSPTGVSWLRAAVLQAGNEEAFAGIFQDLKWCTHILNSTLMSHTSTSQEILCVGNRENPDWLQEDRSLGTQAVLDKRELLENLTQSKQHHSSFQKHDDAIRQYLLERYSQHVRDWAVEGDLPLLLWDTEGDNALPVMEQLGHGAYGKVYKTSWWELDCAMKTFAAATEFRKEAAIWTSLKHPNITQLVCCTKNTKACSIVMELMSTDLRKLMDKRMSDHPNHKVPFSLPVVVDIMLQMARALKYMHGKGLAHLDIKPDNILATPASVPELADQGYVDVKLVDFGEAKPLSTLSSSTCTMDRAKIGTTQYRAPELFQVLNNCCTRDAEESISNRIDAIKADVYSYGITCAELLTGECPYPPHEFQRTDLLSTILQGVRPHLPHEYCRVPLQDLIVRCWDTQPCSRPTFLEVCEGLMNFKTVIFNH